MKVLVTGGSGFIGSHVVDRLATAGCRVTVLDRLERDRRDGTASHRAGAVVDVRGDVRRPGDWAAALDGADVVCHLAARVGLGVDYDDVTGYVEHNDLGTAVGLRAMHHKGFRGRLVLASSMVVYGEGAYRCRLHGSQRPSPRTTEDLGDGRYDPRCVECGADLEPVTVDEDAPLVPRNVYAATKVHQEHLMAVFGAEHGVPVARLRYHNVYGPRMPIDTPYAGVASIFRSALARGEAPRVLEDGRQRRDFVHVDDVARATVLAALAPTPLDGAVNVASGEPRTVLDLANAMTAAFAAASDDPAAAARRLAPVVVGGGRPGDVRHVVASPARAQQLLGFRAARSFADGIGEIVAARPRPAAPATETQR